MDRWNNDSHVTFLDVKSIPMVNMYFTPQIYSQHTTFCCSFKHHGWEIHTYGKYVFYASNILNTQSYLHSQPHINNI